MSLVIPSPDGDPVLLECLAALEPQVKARGDVEVVVVDASGLAAGIVGRRFPYVRVLPAPESASVPGLRGLGIAAASAAVVALLDPDCLVGGEWISEAIAIHEDQSVAAAGGSVALAPVLRRRVSAWAAYLFDYWEFTPPVPAGDAAVLAANSIVYKRTRLPDDSDLRSRGFWKAFVNSALADEGGVFRSSPRLGVLLQRCPPLGWFIRSRYYYGRSYAAMRVESAQTGTRLLRALTTPVLPVVFVGRQLRGLLAKPTYLAWFLLCAPLLLVAHTAWAWGELWGYLAGAGQSHDAIRF